MGVTDYLGDFFVLLEKILNRRYLIAGSLKIEYPHGSRRITPWLKWGVSHGRKLDATTCPAKAGREPNRKLANTIY
jgi:hypothetical protein